MGTVEARTLADVFAKHPDLEMLAIEAIDDDNQLFEPRGPRPPDAPRDVKIRVSDSPGGWALLLVGILFTGVASIFVIAGLGFLASGSGGLGGLLFTLFPLIHLSIGLGMIWSVLGRFSKRRALYQSGVAAMARVRAVGQNSSIRINGRNPYELVWTFDLDGHTYHDKDSTFNDDVLLYEAGDPMWIVYDPLDPEKSAEWPPL